MYDSRKAYQSHLKNHQHALEMLNFGTNHLGVIEDETAPKDNVLFLEESDVHHDIGQHINDGSFVASRCLFCNADSSTLELNLEHMSKLHGMFIPNQEYLYDVESLLGYLFQIVFQFHACIYCETTKSSVEGVQHHMRDKGHCMTNFDDDSEFEDFYDFSAPDSETEGAKAIAGGDDEADQIADQRMQATITATSHELLRLTSGKTLGHHSQSRYYRQHLPTPTKRAEYAQRKAITDSSSSEHIDPQAGSDRQVTTHANAGMMGVPEQQQRALRAVEKKIMKQEVRVRNDYQWGVQKGANRQKHFRVSYKESYNELIGADEV